MDKKVEVVYHNKVMSGGCGCFILFDNNAIK